MIAYINELKEIKIIDKIFNIMKQENFNDIKMILLPINNQTKTKRIERVSSKLCKILCNENIRTVILSNNLMKNIPLKENLKTSRIRALDGSLVYNLLLPQILEIICAYKDTDIKDEKVSILVNENSEVNLNNILTISQKVKSINIVTNYIQKFTKIADYLYEELGILVRISNNIKKDLLKSSVIINIDFNEDLINKYYINTNAIVVNIPENITIRSKKFVGININSYNIIIPEEYKVTDFDDKYIYEGKICHMNIINALRNIEKDEVKIKNLMGKNGILNKKEFLTLKY